MAGAALPAVSKLLRHRDPKLTMALYAHLAPEYLRAEVDRLSFGVKPAEAESAAPPARAVNAGASGADRCKTVQAHGHLRSLPGRVNDLLSVREIAARLGVSTATVYKLCGHGELPH